jgi:hypothetical protein
MTPNLTPQALADRYQLLCRSTHPDAEPSASAIQTHLDDLRRLLQIDLLALARRGSPDDFADIYFALTQELERFREFCAFPALAGKFIVAFGGAFSAGKSSFINALLDKRLLPVQIDPTTSLPTYLLRGDTDAICALNLFGHRMALSDEEFSSLNHDEPNTYGSHIANLLGCAFVTRANFPWPRLAFADTPGYTRPDDASGSARTDERLARTQLNAAQAIVWVVSAENGGINESDLQFLASLQSDIPRLVIVTRADKKTPQDMDDIVRGIRRTLTERNLPPLAVVPVSSRKKDEYPLDILLTQLDVWNKTQRQISFGRNFKGLFTRYARFIEGKRNEALLNVNRLNRIIAIADSDEVSANAKGILSDAKTILHKLEELDSSLRTLEQNFMGHLNANAVAVGFPLSDSPCEHSQNEQATDTHEPVRKALASTENLGVEIQLILVKDTSDDVRVALAGNKKLVELAQWQLVADPSQRVIYALAANPALMETIQFRLCDSSAEFVKEVLSKNPNLAESLQLKLAEGTSNLIGRYLACNKNLFESAQLKLVGNTEYSIRRDLAKNKKLTESAQLKLVGDTDKSVRDALAENTNIAESVQLALAGDVEDSIRRDLARNNKLTESAQLKLSGDTDTSVRHALAVNVNLAESVQLVLAGDVEHLNRYALVENEKLTESAQLKLSGDTDKSVRNALAEIVNLAESVQLVLAGDVEDSIRCALAENANLTESAQLKLVGDTDRSVREDLAENTHITESVQLKLAEDAATSVRCSLAKNINLVKSVQLKLEGDADDDVRRCVFGLEATSKSIFGSFSWNSGIGGRAVSNLLKFWF